MKKIEITCPNCGSELEDAEPNVTLRPYPPVYKVKCTECDYEGAIC